MDVAAKDHDMVCSGYFVVGSMMCLDTVNNSNNI